MSSEIKDESKAANFLDSMFFCLFFLIFVGNWGMGLEFDFLGNRGALLWMEGESEGGRKRYLSTCGACFRIL